MTLKQILWFGAACAVLSLVAVFTFDRPAAVAAAGLSAAWQAPFDAGTAALEQLSLWQASKYLVGFVLLAAGFALRGRDATRTLGNVLAATAVAHLASRLIAGVLKNVFLRSRPWELLESGRWDLQFFVDGGSSLPSGHAAHFWGFFFVLAYAWPRWRVPLLIIPVFIAAARVVVGDHFPGDVLASIAVAAFVSAGTIALFERFPRFALGTRQAQTPSEGRERP